MTSHFVTTHQTFTLTNNKQIRPTYFQVRVVEVAVGRLTVHLVFVVRFNDPVKEVAEQDVGLSIARHTPGGHRATALTFVHTE